MGFDAIRKSFHQINKIRFRPALLYNIGKAYFQRQILRKPTLRICEFSITPACQSKCEFCYASKFARQSDSPITLDEIRNIWRQAKSLGAFSSVLFGGEPLLHPQFLDIVALLEPKKHIVTFTTNGIALTREMLVELKRLGVYLVNISVNSLDAEVNDKLRGYSGHLDIAMRAIEMCKELGMDVFLPVATAKDYWDETMRIVEFADRNDCGVTINLMCPMGRAEGRKEDLFDKEFWANLRQLYNSHSNARSDYDVNLSMRIGCPSAHEKIHIGPYGDVTGCSMQAPSFGDARHEKLADIVARMRAFRHYAKLADYCLVALDDEYIQNYTDFAQTYDSIPYPIVDNPHYAADSGGYASGNGG